MNGKTGGGLIISEEIEQKGLRGVGNDLPDNQNRLREIQGSSIVSGTALHE